MPHVAARTASRDRDTGRYQSHRPEQTLLYQGAPQKTESMVTPVFATPILTTSWLA